MTVGWSETSLTCHSIFSAPTITRNEMEKWYAGSVNLDFILGAHRRLFNDSNIQRLVQADFDHSSRAIDHIVRRPGRGARREVGSGVSPGLYDNARRRRA